MKIIFRIIAIILFFFGFTNLTSNFILSIILLVTAILFFLGTRSSKVKVSFSKPSSRKRISRKFSAIGNIESKCPHCNHNLDKRPGRKKKCPHCSAFIFVRTRPGDQQRVLVTEEQAEQIEEQWSIVNGTHGEYLNRKKQVENERLKLKKRFGCRPSENDVKWSILNKDSLKHAQRRDWGLYRNARFAMAELLRRESKTKGALGMYLEVCYLDLNGPNNVGGITSKELLKEYPPWNPKSDGFLAPGIISRLDSIIAKSGIEKTSVENLFNERASKLKKSLNLSVNIEKAWKTIEKELP